MALQKSLTLENGVILNEAYIKISTFLFYNKTNESSYVEVRANVFKDQQARIDGKPEVISFVHKCTNPNFNEYFSLTVLNDENKNMISQAYAWMKTMTAYSGSIDMIDSKE